MHRAIQNLLCFSSLLLSLPGTLPAADVEEDEDYPPGLLARYQTGDLQVERVDPDVQFAWGAGSPDARLPPGPFTAHWSGKLLVRSEGTYRLHLYLQGEARVLLNGKAAVFGSSEKPGWVVGAPLPLEFGELPIEITFRNTQPEAVVKLYWSQENFPLEPIPPQLLFRDAPAPELARLERGRELYFALRCNRCHPRPDEPSADSAPALTDAAFQPGWLVDWLTKPAAQPAHSRMPAFGFSQGEAASIAAYLHSTAPAKAVEAIPDKPGENALQRGRVLVRSVGCLACHTFDKLGSTALSAGGDLTNVHRKRSASWIETWLADQELAQSPDRRMPAVQLSATERRDIADFLASDSTGKAAAPGNALARANDPQQTAAGGRLIAAARCAACHRIPNITFEPGQLPVKPLSNVDGSTGCFQKTPDAERRRPAYNLDDDERAALVAYLKSTPPRRDGGSAFEQGRVLLRQKNCLACHERDGGRGISSVAGKAAITDPDLHGLSEAMIPPDLTAVGDKLQDEPLSVAASGRQRDRRLPWLRVRMPVFEHTEAERQALQSYLVGHDRIPAHAGDAAIATADVPKLAPAGVKLLGPQGFSCVACHRVAAFEPRNVALGTRGSDLYRIGERMRPEFFRRWTRSPLRIMPGIEMPSYEKPVAGVLDAHLGPQLDALWVALNQKTAPVVDVPSIEQVWLVQPGEPARIIRDVFRLQPALSAKPEPAAKPEFVHRAFAAGFGNGVNVLFDLESMSLRQWWTGDFARQRTAGKSWFWEPSGPVLLGAARGFPDLVLRRKQRNDAVLIPRREGTTFGHLTAYRAHADGVELQYKLTFDVPEKPVTLQIRERFAPLTSNATPAGGSGWSRAISASGLPEGYQLCCLISSPIVSDGPAASVSTAEPGAQASAWTPVTLPESAPGGGTAVPASLLDLRTDETSAVIAYRVGAVAIRTPSLATAPSAPSTIRPPVEPVTTVPGYEGQRLPLPRSIMPTALTWTKSGALAFCSLKGEVYIARDSDGDGLEDKLELYDEGLAAPYGIIADGDDLLVAHKPELLRLRDTDGDGRADVRQVLAEGWGYNDNYHDWTFGIVRDSKGNLYVGLGSDYAQPGRPRESSRWRGKVLRIDPAGKITPMGHAFRYPTGLAITPDDQIFVSDNQGVGNTFNEINHLVEGGRYGVPSLYEEPYDGPILNPAIQVPHPWTRSVNGLFFLPASLPGQQKPGANRFGPFAGQGIGCEYDSRFLMRFSLQRIGATYQGAAYPFSLPPEKNATGGFLGTLCGGVSPSGDIYIGSIHDSGWLGGLNVGDLVRLRPQGKLPPGIRELQAQPDGFVIHFTDRVDVAAASRPDQYSISGYTRVWAGAYATPDSGRHKVEVKTAHVSADGLSVQLTVDRLQENYVYDVTCGRIGTDPNTLLWPATGHYTMNRIPK